MYLRVCEVTFHEDAAKNSGEDAEEFEAMGSRESVGKRTEGKTSWIVIRNDGSHTHDGPFQREERDLANERFQLVYHRNAGSASEEDEDEDEDEDDNDDDNEEEDNDFVPAVEAPTRGPTKEKGGSTKKKGGSTRQKGASGKSVTHAHTRSCSKSTGQNTRSKSQNNT